MASFIPMVQPLSSNGDGTGTADLAGNHLATPAEFYITSPTSVSIFVARVLVYVQDSGTFDSDKFANGLVLANGITLEYREADDTVVSDLTPQPIMTNGHWGKYAYDVQVHTYGQGDEYLGSRWTFAKFVDGGLDLRSGRKLVATINDDLSEVNAFTLIAQGWKSE